MKETEQSTHTYEIIKVLNLSQVTMETITYKHNHGMVGENDGSFKPGDSCF